MKIKKLSPDGKLPIGTLIKAQEESVGEVN